MEFNSRIKKEMTEGIVRAILADAGYRVIGLGIENVVRETECLTVLEYAGLDFPKVMRSLPDLLIMDKEQTEKHLVEVKYRSSWSSTIFDEINEQVHLFKELILVFLNSTPPISEGRSLSPGSYLRCCKVRSNDGILEAYLYAYGSMAWVPRTKINDSAGQWWGLRPIQDVLPKVNEAKDEQTLLKAVDALRGILNT